MTSDRKSCSQIIQKLTSLSESWNRRYPDATGRVRQLEPANEVDIFGMRGKL